jgi:hypothetical protein
MNPQRRKLCHIPYQRAILYVLNIRKPATVHILTRFWVCAHKNIVLSQLFREKKMS